MSRKLNWSKIVQWHMATPTRPVWGRTVQMLTFPGVVEAIVTEAVEPDPDAGYTTSLYSVPPLPASCAMMCQCHQPVFCPDGGEKIWLPSNPAGPYTRTPQLPPP